MRKYFVLAVLSLGVLQGQAQEKVMDIQMADGTSTRTRLADLKQISFLTVEEGGQRLIVKTLGGETAAVLFETNPIVTVSDGKLVIKPASADAMEFEITDIAEILFGKESTAINELEGFACVLQDGGVLLRNIPRGIEPRVYSIDGRSLPTPPMRGSEMRLSRETLGKGIFIVKAGTFSTKIKL